MEYSLASHQIIRNKSLDIMKAVSVYMVIILHYGFSYCWEYVSIIANCAVPFFFMISGYYATGRSSKRQIMKLIYICRVNVSYTCF